MTRSVSPVEASVPPKSISTPYPGTVIPFIYNMIFFGRVSGPRRISPGGWGVSTDTLRLAPLNVNEIG